MKSFYVIAALVAAALILSPMLLLEGPDQTLYAGKVVSFGTYGAEVKSLDPATCGDTTSAGIQGNFYEGLYCYHYLKRPVEVIPQLAEGLPQISDDGLTYTIGLKAGVKYFRNPCFGHDGNGRPATRTVRAEDFVLAFKRIADYHINTGLAWAFLSGRIAGLDDWREKSRTYEAGDFSRYDLPVEGLQAVDELTLRIRLRENFPQMIYVLAIGVYAPIPREAVDYWLASTDDGQGGRESIPPAKRTTEFRRPEEVVGTGPYLLTKFVRGGVIVLERNPEFREDYYPAEGAAGDAEAGLLADANRRVPFVDVQYLDFVQEDYTAWELFLSRQVDASGIPKETFEFVIRPNKELAEQWQRRSIRLHKYAQPVVFWLVFNMEDPVLGASKSLRQALCLAFDVESYIKVLYNGRGIRADNILPSDIKGHDEAGLGPYNRLDVPAAREKLEQAKAELAAAGKLIDGQIPELTLSMGGTDRATARMGEFVQQQFAKIGVRLKFELMDWPTLQEKVNNKQTQVYTMGWHGDYPDAENFLQLFYSPNIAKGTNNANYAHKDFDRLYEQVRTMNDSPQRTALYVQMVRMISEDCPVLLLSEPLSFVLTYDWVRNVKAHPFGYGFFKYRQIDTAQRRRLGGRER
jgi:ABC-type transport system substrate-binding protein